MTDPLAGIRVIDLTTFLSGPSTTRALADLGAEVIKVEPPTGDRTRAGSGLRPGDPPSEFWLALHRDRRSVVLDLKTDAARDLLLELAVHADVFVENFRPGVTDQLGIGYEAVSRANPRIVYCTITGFGPDGPYADRPATDGPVQAFTGALELTGAPGGFGLPVPIQVADLVAGAYATQAVLAGLLARHTTGLGTHADVSMAECLLGWLEITDRNRTLAPPTTLVLESADGVALLVQTTMHFADRFVELVGAVPGGETLLTDARFATRDDRKDNLDAYVEVVQRAFRTRDAEQWLDALRTVGIPAARIQTSADARGHAQLAHRAATVDVDVPGLGTRTLLAGPFRFDGERRRDLAPPPALGEHTREVLTELLGCTDDRLDELTAAGAFGPTATATDVRAVRVHRHGEPAEALEVDDDVAVPEPGPDQVRVRVEATALSMPDVMLCRGGYPLTPTTLPFVPGMEAAGVVTALGDGVDPAWLGQRVVGTGILPHGTIAEETLMRAPGLYPVPDGVSPAAAATTHIAFTTAHAGLHRRAALRSGETLLVTAAAGGTGNAAVQLGAVAGARVIAVASGADRQAVCRELGADVALDARSPDLAKEVLAANDGRGVDVVFEPVGGDTFTRGDPLHRQRGPHRGRGLRRRRRGSDPRGPPAAAQLHGDGHLHGRVQQWRCEPPVHARHARRDHGSARVGPRPRADRPRDGSRRRRGRTHRPRRPPDDRPPHRPP